jgi:hypothetical protein
MKVATRTIVGDGLTPVRAYAALRAADPNGASFLLESVVGGERWGRFSILGYRPKYEAVLDRSGWSIRGNGPAFTPDPNAKDAIVAASALFAPEKHTGDMATRFARSHVGYMAWDIVHVIDKVPPGNDETWKKHYLALADLAAGGADGCGHGRDALLALADGLGPAAAADAGQGGRGEGGVLQAAVHALGVLPGQQDLGGRAGAHRQLGPDRDGVAQAAGALGRGDADAVLALAAPELGGLAGDVAQSRQHGAGGGEQAVLTRGGGELGETRAEHEPALHVACHQSVVLECHGEPVRSRSGQTGAGHESGEGGRAGLQCGQHEGCLVEDADST